MVKTESAALLPAPAQQTGPRPAPVARSFVAVIACESVEAIKPATDLVYRVVTNEITYLEVCVFDSLRFPRIFRRAAEAAVRADLMVFATHGCGELPPTIRSWVAHWAALRDESRPGTLTALCTCPPVIHTAVSLGPRYLQAIGELTGMEYVLGDTVLRTDPPGTVGLHPMANIPLPA